MISVWTTVILISLLYFYDFFFYSSAKEKEIFYIPIFIELSLVLAGFLLYYFEAPERFFPKTKWVQLYLNGYLFFTIFFLNFCVEAQTILVDAIKFNSGYYDEKLDNWWHIDNIYHKEYN